MLLISMYRVVNVVVGVLLV